MTLRRLVMIGIGYLAARCVGACVILAALIFFSTSQDPTVIDFDLVSITALMFVVLSSSVAVLGLMPALPALAYAERNAITSPTWYAAAGAGAGLLALGLNLALTAPSGGIGMSDLSDHPAFTSLASVATIAAAAGISAGYMFWLVAGRHTGRIS